MNVKRIVSGLIAFPILASILILGNKYIVDVAFSIVSVLCVNEFYKSFKPKARPVEWLGYFYGAFIIIIHLLPKELGTSVMMISIPLTILILFAYVIFSNMKRTIYDVMITLLGIIYIISFIMCLSLIYGMQNGKILIWYVLFAAWGTDMFAYFIGKKFGKHKLKNSVSPNKSIEGCIAGTFGSIILVVGYNAVINNVFNIEISYIFAALYAIVMSIIGQIGDLAASSIKRYNEIKDFSNLIPGHGGMLDRFDSVIFIAPFAYFILTMIV